MGSNTPEQEIGPLNFENVIAHLVGHTADGRTFSYYLCPLSLWLTLPQGVLSTS